jgi:hypothetical protein
MCQDKSQILENGICAHVPVLANVIFQILQVLASFAIRKL